jgi:hypothetical protein
MKTTTLQHSANPQKFSVLNSLKGKIGKNNFFVYAFQLVLLYILVFAALSTFAQSPAKVATAPGKLEFAKQTIVFNSGKVYLNWVSKANSNDCVYVIERSVDGVEYEPVGLKEGIGSPVELLYSWVDTKPVTGTAHYRIKQVNDQGTMVSQADPKSVTAPDTDPLFMNKGDHMVQVK